MGLREWSSKAYTDRFGSLTGGVMLYRDRIVHGRDEQPLIDVRARVETSGELQTRITATRLLATGALALAWRKKKDTRAVLLTIEGPDFAWLIEVDQSDEAAARRFAAKVVDASRKATATQ